MPKPKCFYLSSGDNMCCRSTSEHHCETVTSEICDGCIMKQVGKPETSDKQKLKEYIQQAIDFIEATDEPEALLVLKKALLV